MSISMLCGINFCWSISLVKLIILSLSYFSEATRVAITHLRPVQLSDAQAANAKILFGIRNPKDAAVSMFHHIRKELTIQLQGTWDQFFDLFVNKQGNCDLSMTQSKYKLVKIS